VTAETTEETPVDAAAVGPATSLKFFPLSTFAMIMGIVGLGLAWRDAAHAFPVPRLVGEVIIGFGAGFYCAILAVYALKIIRFKDPCVADARDPSACNYLAAITISLLLVSAGLHPYNAALSEGLWLTGAAGQVLVMVYIVGRLWFGGIYSLDAVSPAWFVPVVGSVVAPLTGSHLGYDALNWMILGGAVFFWIVAFTLNALRFLSHPPPPPIHRPSMVIFLAPPSLCFAAYVELQGGYVDNIANMLMGITIITALLLLARVQSFLGAPFSMRWWSYTFPLAAFAKAVLLYHFHLDDPLTRTASIGAIGLATLVVLLVFSVTLRFMFRGGLFLPQD